MKSDTAFYRNLYYTDGESPVFCYRSGLSVYEESFENGMLVSKGRNAAGYPLNVLSNCPTRLNSHSFAEPQSFNLEIDGESADMYLELLTHSEEETEKGLLVKIKLKSTVKPVEITVCTLLDGTAVLTRYLEIKNLSDSAVSVNNISVIAGGTESMRDVGNLTNSKNPSDYYSLGYFDASEWGKEGDFAFRPLRTDITAFGGRFGRDRFRQPFFMLKNNLQGTILFAQLAWSGGYEFSFDYNAHTERDGTDLSFKAELKAYKPMLVLDPGEAYTTPEVHVGFIAGDVDDAVNAGNEHIRRSVLTLPEAAPDYYVGSGMGAEHDMSLETTKSFIDQMAYIGCEVFIIDAGWYAKPGEENRWHELAGDWVTYDERYPGGLRELCDYAHKKGMRFGVWVEIERLGCCSKMLMKKHPEWSTEHFDGELGIGYLDFSDPECAKWAEDEAARIIEKSGLDLFRVDYNMNTRDYFFIKNHGGKRECASLRHFEAVYRMYDNLKKRFPDVVFENCAGGGGRCDLGMLKAFNHTWVSDRQTAPRSVYITNGMTLMLPPERVDRLVAGMGCHQYGSPELQMRNAMLGHISMNVFSPAAAEYNTKQLEFIRRSLDVYKNKIRSILPLCLVYHHEPEVEKIKQSGSTALEIFSPDGLRGAMTVFTVPGFAGNSVTVFPRGCDAEKVYNVTFDNSRSTVKIRGYELLNAGIKIQTRAPMASELVLFEAD